MKFLDVHPDDAQWLRRWLRSNLLCFLAILCFAVAIRFDPVPPVGVGPAQALQTSSRLDQQSRIDGEGLAPRPVAPQGWRRTSHGWEHVSNWPVQRSLAEIIQFQKAREPAWMQVTLASVRKVPPLMFAAAQVLAIVLIINFAGRRTAAS